MFILYITIVLAKNLVAVLHVCVHICIPGIKRCRCIVQSQVPTPGPLLLHGQVIRSNFVVVFVAAMPTTVYIWNVHRIVDSNSF